jgi:hypothetical protein
MGKRLCTGPAIAWRPNATPHVVDYGRQEVPNDIMDEEAAILSALRDFRAEVVKQGWSTSDGRHFRPTFVFVDCGNWHNTILQFIEESGPPFFGAWGYGIGQRSDGQYKRESGAVVEWTKDGYALIRKPDGREYLEVDANRSKSWLHARIRTPVDQPGALTLFESNDHLSFAKQVCESEKEEQHWSDAGIGMVKRWVAISRINHWFDSTANACVAGLEAGMRLIEPPPQPPPPPPPPPPATPWLPDITGWMPPR